MLLLRNQIQPYAWGRLDGMSDLVGTEPSGGPEAELWVGTHPSAPSIVVGDPEGQTLAEVIASDPARWLGPVLAGRGWTSLPFLLKVLSIGEPLSLQAHPSAAQARDGYDRENEAGIPLDAPQRTYRDPSAKPESLVALRETWALCGFRTAVESRELVAGLGLGDLSPLIDALDHPDQPTALEGALSWILGVAGPKRSALSAAAVAAAERMASGGAGDPYRWVVNLGHQHPGDLGCLAPLLVDLVRLAPGDAVHLPAGNLHAYLSGAGVEIMAASDNVLRGGLTPKYIDTVELLHILRFEPGVPPAPIETNPAPGMTAYDCGEDAFRLAVIDASSDAHRFTPEGPSLLLATGGPVRVTDDGGSVELSAGRAAFVPAGSGELEVIGPGRLWWATVGSELLSPCERR